MALVLLTDGLLRSGWMGGLGQIIGSDFVTLYAAGQLFRDAPQQLYDFTAQRAAQQALIAPTPLPGLNPFISPPYVAAAYRLLTVVPLPWAFALWTGFALVCVLLAAHLLGRAFVAETLRRDGLSATQLAVLALSSFACVSGLRVGQNHTLTLALVSALLVAQQRKRWVWVGVLTGLLLYKPHFTLGLLIVWVAWQRWEALLAFAAVAAAWLGATVLSAGVNPFIQYLKLSPTLLTLPYTEGFPAYLFITPQGLLQTLLPHSAAFWIQASFQALAFLLALGLYRRARRAQDADTLSAALLYPLLVMPYALLHDALLLLPALLLLARAHPTRRLRDASILIYLGTLFLPLLGYATHLALPALLTLLAGWVWVKEMEGV